VSSRKPPTTLGKLEFLDIKKSLIDYLRSQSVFSGYEFEGSALSTLVDLMSYNTYYYALYSNMIANEAFLDSAQRIESLISLTKPLGYTIPSKTAAKCKVALSGISEGTTIIPRKSVFYGKNSEGTQFKFYNLEDVPVVDSQTDFFYIYEGKNFVEVEAVDLIDIERQRIVISDDNFDLETLKVIVTDPQSDVDEEWTRIDNIGYSNTVEEKIYFVERTETGFILSFGLLNSVGKNITEDVRSVKITYLTTNGSLGNNITLYTSLFGNVVVFDGIPSFGGKDDPSLGSIKFLAPKWFASQERAVTSTDYKALILEAGFFASENEFNVYGGEEIVPRRYGRVFITSVKQPSEVSDMMQFIKERSVITVLPEYVASTPLVVYVDFTFRFNDGVPRTSSQKQEIANRIKSLFNQIYGSGNRFNLYFSASEFVDQVKLLLPQVEISPDDFKIYVEQTVNATLSDYVFNLQNEIDIGNAPLLRFTEPFMSTQSTVPVVYAVDNDTPFLQKPLKLLSSDLTTVVNSNVGNVNIETGTVLIKSKIMKTPTKFTIPFRQKTIKIGLNNLVSFSIKNITIA
jgi:hypothetical protein